MFYPAALPNAAPGMSAERMLDVESVVMELLIRADRGWFRHHGEGIVREILHELRFAGHISVDEVPQVDDLLQENRSTLLDYVAHAGTRPSSVDWQDYQPDWSLVRKILGEAGAARWRAELGRRLRMAQEDARRLQEEASCALA